MSLYESFFTDCAIMNKITRNDGEGGIITEWQQGAIFPAAITISNTLEAERARKEGVTSLYKVSYHKRYVLEYNTYIKRLSDGKTFRLTSDPAEVQSPAGSSIDMAQANAEERGLPL